MGPLPQNARTGAALFVTCIIGQLYPEVGVSVVRVLRRLGVKVDFPLDQTCCGQPLYNAGFTRQGRKLAERVLRSFGNSRYVVVPSGSCAAMMRVFYQDLFRDDPKLRRQALDLSAKVYAGWREGGVDDVQELLTQVRVIISSSSQLAALKAIMARHTGEGGWENMRPPLVALDDGQRSQLFAELDATGFSPPPVS